MTDNEFLLYLDRLQVCDNNAIVSTLYSDLDPLVQQRRILELKNLAVHRLGMEAAEFESLYQAEIEKLSAGNQKRIESIFEIFEPFDIADTTQLPPFPVECLPPALRDYAQAIADSKQVSVDMAAVACLTVVSLAVHGKVLVNPKPGWIEPVNLYTVVVALPSDRKSPTLQAVAAPVYAYVKQENEQRAPEIEEYQTKKGILVKYINNILESISKPSNKTVTMEDVLAKKRELAELEEEAVRPLRLMADDVTPEKLVDLMADNGGKMAIVSSEGGIFDLIAGRYSDKLNLDIFLKAYSGDPVMVDRKNGPSKQIDRPALTILLMTQPKVLTSIMGNGEFRGRGFLARFLYSIPKSIVGARKYETPDIPISVKEAYRVLITSLLSIPDADNPPLIRFSPEAYEVSKKFFEELEPRLVDDLEDIEDWAGKFHGQVMRIAALLHCCQYTTDAASSPLSAETVQRAVTVGNYFLEHAKAAFDIMGMAEPQEEKDAKYILKRLDTVEGDSISKRDLQQLCKNKDGFKTMEEFEPKLLPLVDRGYLHIETVASGKKGRPTEIVYINPEYKLKYQKSQKSQKSEAN